MLSYALPHTTTTRWQKFLYMLCTPLLKHIEFPLVWPDSDDYIQAKVKEGSNAEAEKTAGENFTVNALKVPLPKELRLSQLGAGTVIKKAGPLSNKNMSAATLWLLGHRRELRTIGAAWPGTLVG